jgi:hypothetical protein
VRAAAVPGRRQRAATTLRRWIARLKIECGRPCEVTAAPSPGPREFQCRARAESRRLPSGPLSQNCYIRVIGRLRPAWRLGQLRQSLEGAGMQHLGLDRRGWIGDIGMGRA